MEKPTDNSTVPVQATPARRAFAAKTSGMPLGEALALALDSLRVNKLRSGLTLLGIIIGIASIIAVISIIQGLSFYWKDKVADMGANTFVVDRFGIITSHDAFLDAIRRNKRITVQDADAIQRRCFHCEQVAMSSENQAEVKYGNNKITRIDVTGATTNLIEVQKLDVASGRYIGDFEDRSGRMVAFVGHDLVENLFPGSNPLGKQIHLNGRPFEVIGVAEKKGSIFGQSQDNFVHIPIGMFYKMYSSRNSIQIVIKSESPEAMEKAQDEVRVILRARRHLKYAEPDNFGFVTSAVLNELFESMTKIIFSVAIFVVGISLVVGGIVIMNIMLVAVIERTREVGIRKAVGARRQDILKQFLIEAVVLCCVGGIVGVSIAYLISLSISKFTPLPSQFPLWAPVLAIGICSIIGIFFGIYPANKAAKLDPIEALRSE